MHSETAIDTTNGLAPAAGVVAVDDDGRVWITLPKNAFGGYRATFPKGRIEAGDTARETAIREAMEEAGIVVELLAVIGDFDKTTTRTRYYLARRVGASVKPAHLGVEVADAFHTRRPADYLNKLVDLNVLSAARAKAAELGVKMV